MAATDAQRRHVQRQTTGFRDSFAQLWSPQIHVREHVDYGLGWVLADENGLRLALHNGGLDGFHSLMEMVPDKKVGFALLANVDSPALDAQARRIVWTNLSSWRASFPSSLSLVVWDFRLFARVRDGLPGSGSSKAKLKLFS